MKKKEDLQSFMFTVRQLGIEINDIEFNSAYLQSGLSVYTVAATVNNSLPKEYKTHREIIDALRTLEYINYIEEI